MKRLKRWLFKLAAGMSLVLCVAMVAFWVTSYYSSATIRWLHRGRVFVVVCPRGTLAFVSMTDPLGPSGSGLSFRWEMPVVDPFPGLAITHHVEFFGFYYAWESTWRGIGFVSVAQIPFWFAAGMTSILPATLWWLYRAQRRRKRWLAENRCEGCGYDLRATPERCPECGAVPSVMTGATS